MTNQEELHCLNVTGKWGILESSETSYFDKFWYLHKSIYLGDWKTNKLSKSDKPNDKCQLSSIFKHA